LYFIQDQTFFDCSRIFIVDQFIKKAADLTSIAGNFGHAFFARMEFFENYHGNKNIMFLKPK
jgi:hypothetical protein